MFERFAPDAREVLESTPGYAIRLAHNYIGTEHLLLALIGREEREGSGPLVERGLTVDATARIVRERVAAIPTEATALKAVGVDPRALRDGAGRLGVDVRISGLSPVPIDRPPLTQRAHDLLAMAADAGNGAATHDDLLAAMLTQDASLAVIVLEQLGVSIDELRAELAR
jgi:ATP-dependent Clp protease ATP-binding subunit ClpA